MEDFRRRVDTSNVDLPTKVSESQAINHVLGAYYFIYIAFAASPSDLHLIIQHPQDTSEVPMHYAK